MGGYARKRVATKEQGSTTQKGQSLFADFNFQATPDRTPLDWVISELVVEPFLRSDAGGMLALLPFQTGIGKTYTILNLIIEEMLRQIRCSLDSKTGRKRIVIYMTDSVDNVASAYQDLLTLIEQQTVNGKTRFTVEQQTFLKEKILYLPRQSSQLNACSTEIVESLIDLFELRSDKAVGPAWQRFCKLRTHVSGNTELQRIFQAELEEQAQSFYSVLVGRIQSRQKDSHRSLALTPQQTGWLDELFPGDRLRRDEAHVLFMTTQKYLSGCHHSTGKYRPLRDLPNQLLLIDEVDKQNAEILKALTRQKEQDLIRAIRTLHANLRVHRLEKTDLYAGIAPLFDELALDLGKFAEKWHLDFAFNTEGDSLRDQRVSLFSDRMFTHVHSYQHRLLLEMDEDRQKNLILAADRGEVPIGFPETSLFSQFVNHADRLYQRFILVMQRSVQLYIHNAQVLAPNQRDDRSLSSSTQEAVASVLNHYNLSEFIRPVLVAFDARSLSRKTRSRLPARRSYHCNGLKLVDIGLNEGTQDTANCRYYGIPQSPTGLLADMVEEGAIVVGISATAETPTSIHNFDMTYLRHRLGDRFVRLTPAQRAKVHDYYETKRDYAYFGVALKVHFYKSRDNWLNTLYSSYQPSVRNPQMALNGLLGSDGNADFARAWLAKLLQAMERFIRSAENRYMLALLNRIIRRDHEELIHFLEFCAQQCRGDDTREVRLFVGVNADFLRAERYQEILDTLHMTSARVVVITTYQSMGAGKNPDYSVNYEHDSGRLVCVSHEDLSDPLRTDIDSIYLEKPTQLLLSDEDDDVSHRLMQFHQIMSLQERGEIAPAKARDWCRRMLNDENRLLSLKRYYETLDYRWAVRKHLEQAVGRTARTAMKRRQILLMADADLQEFLAEDDRDQRLFSHEYRALVDCARTLVASTPLPRDDRRAYNLAIRNTVESREMVLELLRRIHQTPDESDIRLWENLRRQLLQAPTVLDQPKEYPTLYVQTLGTPQGAYRYHGNIDGRDSDFEFFDRVSTGNVVSEQTARLPLLSQSSVVRTHFETLGFATSWPANPWVMNPVMFQNIYLGALGEQSAFAVFAHYDLECDSLPPEHYERFDAVLSYQGIRALLDVKHWRHSQDDDVAYRARKLATIGQALGIAKGVYVNVLGSANLSVQYSDSEFRPCAASCASVIEIPALICQDSGQVVEQNMIELLNWLGES